MMNVVRLILKFFIEVFIGLDFDSVVFVQVVSVIGGVMVDIIVKQKIKKCVISGLMLRLMIFGVIIDVVIVQVVVVGMFMLRMIDMYIVKNSVSSCD